jgi:hypothetical protein
VQIAIVAQAVLFAVVVVVLFRIRPKVAESADRPAWRGYGTAVLMLLGSGLSGAYAAALVLTVAHLLGKPTATDTGGAQPFVTPMPYFWAAAAALIVAGLAVLLAGLGWWRLCHSDRAAALAKVDAAYPHTDEPARSRAIAGAWARAGLDAQGRELAGWFTVICGALIVTAGVLYVLNRTWVTDDLGLLVNVGDWLVGLFAAGLILLGRRAYTDPNVRRIVGVIWDLGTFWPRATHPLAPPCYAERAVPDLINRIAYLGNADQDRKVLLSCHSQGAVIGTAVVMQLTYAQSRQVALITYGAPLHRLYGRLFPAFFGADALGDAGAFLIQARQDTYTSADRSRWPWRNLYRTSDPIGGPVFPPSGCADVDRLLIDPVFAKSPGDNSYPPTLGHSGYLDDDGYADAADDVEELRILANSLTIRSSAGLTRGSV